MAATPSLVHPPRIPGGARIGVIAPASPAADRGRVDAGIAALEALGHTVDMRVDPLHHHGYYAGTDAERAAALVGTLTDDALDAVACLRGGEGCMRTLLALPNDAIAQIRAARPKPLIGYSDITILHAWLQQHVGWVSFSGPVVTSFAEATRYTVEGFRRALMETAPFTVATPADGPEIHTVVSGRASGRLAGGCLSLVQALIGTPWQPDLDGAILCVEDVGEPPRRIDQMLTQLLAAGLLDRVAGVLVGELVSCGPRVRGDSYPNSLTIEQVLDELLVPLGVPVLHGLPIGHGRHIATLPLGVMAELDADTGVLRVQPGVS
ncbi:LD-carboxypeptidase [soil metagenome]